MKADSDAQGAGGAPQLAGRVGLPTANLFKVHEVILGLACGFILVSLHCGKPASALMTCSKSKSAPQRLAQPPSSVEVQLCSVCRSSAPSHPLRPV